MWYKDYIYVENTFKQLKMERGRSRESLKSIIFNKQESRVSYWGTWGKDGEKGRVKTAIIVSKFVGMFTLSYSYYPLNFNADFVNLWWVHTVMKGYLRRKIMWECWLNHWVLKRKRNVKSSGGSRNLTKVVTYWGNCFLSSSKRLLREW